ncbi:MAG TPA: CooT family nickel-binding protein [Spirochaetia bacterium]|nr:CooT family nickel-binding protein [Spirochaetia bacterium]
MCEANAYLRRGDKDELYLEMVDKVVPQPEGLVLEDIFGRRKVLKGRILELALVDHRIVLEEDQN